MSQAWPPTGQMRIPYQAPEATRCWASEATWLSVKSTHINTMPWSTRTHDDGHHDHSHDPIPAGFHTHPLAHIPVRHARAARAGSKSPASALTIGPPGPADARELFTTHRRRTSWFEASWPDAC